MIPRKSRKRPPASRPANQQQIVLIAAGAGGFLLLLLLLASSGRSSGSYAPSYSPPYSYNEYEQPSRPSVSPPSPSDRGQAKSGAAAPGTKSGPASGKTTVKPWDNFDGAGDSTDPIERGPLAKGVSPSARGGSGSSDLHGTHPSPGTDPDDDPDPDAGDSPSPGSGGPPEDEPGASGAEVAGRGSGGGPRSIPKPWEGCESWKTYTVQNTGSGGGSLSDALEKAKDDGVPSRIVFKTSGVIRSQGFGFLSSDLVIDGLTAPAPGIAIDVGWGKHAGLAPGGRHILIRGLTITHSGTADGVTFLNGVAGDSMIEWCTLINNYDEGVGLTQKTRNLIVANCRFEGDGAPPSNGRGMLISLDASATVVNSVVRHCLRGINANTKGSFVDIRNCLIEDCKEYGVAVNASKANVVDCVIRNNHEGIRLKGGGQMYVKGTNAPYSENKPNAKSPIVVKDTPFPSWIVLKTPSEPDDVGAPSYPPEIKFAGSFGAYLQMRPAAFRRERGK